MIEGAVYQVKFRLNNHFTHDILVFTQDATGDDVVRLARLGWEREGEHARGSEIHPATAPIKSVARLGPAVAP